MIAKSCVVCVPRRPKEGLESMKFDKCGGMAVFGIMQAAAALKLKCNLTALIPAAENSVSGEAYRPGDIITMMDGKTVEIISADAEGRLILADALTYAQKHCKPTRMINFATLTGGVVVTLGKVAAGLMCNQDELAAELTGADEDAEAQDKSDEVSFVDQKMA